MDLSPADAVVERVRSGVAAGDWSRVRLLLHPYLHWGLPDGVVLRGRHHVLAMLTETGVPAHPARVELRDGQVYRWTVDRTGDAVD